MEKNSEAYKNKMIWIRFIWFWSLGFFSYITVHMYTHICMCPFIFALKFFWFDKSWNMINGPLSCVLPGSHIQKPPHINHTILIGEPSEILKGGSDTHKFFLFFLIKCQVYWARFTMRPHSAGAKEACQDGFTLMKQILGTILSKDKILPKLRISPNSCYTTKLLYLGFIFPSPGMERPNIPNIYFPSEGIHKWELYIFKVHMMIWYTYT